MISLEGVLVSSSRGRLRSTWPVHRPGENPRKDAGRDLRLIGWLDESVRMLGPQIRSHHRVTVLAQEKWIFVSPRGGEELWRQSKKHPGRLLKEGMKELSRYLADRAGDGGQEEWSQRRVMAYINQVLLQQGGLQGIGLRNQREAVTLGTCLDHLLSGDLPALGDTLMQRLKALESSIQDQGWQSARHLEIIPPQAASLASMEEKDRAAKQELRMIKLRGAMSRVKSPK